MRGRIPFGLHADDLDVRIDRLRADRHARDQSAAADRHHQHVEVRRLLQHLEPQRPLPRDHRRIVERMHQRELPALSFLERKRARFVELRAMQNHFRIEHARLLHFRVRRRARHDDARRNAEPAAVIRNRLRVIAGRHRDDAAPAFVRREIEQSVQRAALLERRRELVVLELQMNLRAGQRRQRLRVFERSQFDFGCDPLLRSSDVARSDDGVVSHRSQNRWRNGASVYSARCSATS